MGFYAVEDALNETTGVRHILSLSATGVRPTFYRSCAFIFSTLTGVGRMFYRSLAYIFAVNPLNMLRFLEVILLNMMLKKLKTSPPELMLLFRNGGLGWK